MKHDELAALIAETLDQYEATAEDAENLLWWGLVERDLLKVRLHELFAIYRRRFPAQALVIDQAAQAKRDAVR